MVIAKLEEISRIESPGQRMEALVAYARRLGINVLKAKKPDGEYSEHELTVLIFDAERAGKISRMQKFGFLTAAFFIMLCLLGMILIFQWMTS